MMETQVIIQPITQVIGMPDQHWPVVKVAMDRPQQSRGLATGPGAQRKAPRTVIRRAVAAAGRTIDQELRSSPVAGLNVGQNESARSLAAAIAPRDLVVADLTELRECVNLLNAKLLLKLTYLPGVAALLALGALWHQRL